MNLISKEILMSHLQRSEGAEEVSLPIDFFRDLLYQAMPRTWVGLTDDDFYGQSELQKLAMKYAETKLKEKNNG